MNDKDNNSSSSSSSDMINRVFSQLGVRFVKDRSSCSLAACRTSVCHQALPSRRLVNQRSKPMETSQGKLTDRKRRFCSDGAASTGQSETCRVCHDEASGFHYGAVTCDSCKMFFERSVRDRHIYDCHFRRSCDLRLQRRNHCQGCRWDRCLEVGMIVNAVCKTRTIEHETVPDIQHHHRHGQWTRLDAEDMLRLADQSSNLAATPRPSLPSPTDTDNSQYDVYWDDETGGRVVPADSQSRQEPLPFGFQLLRDALIPLDSPESLAARLTDLERSCLASLFRWNKRRLEHRADGSFVDGNFGAAAANLTPILLATAARQVLCGCHAAPSESAIPTVDVLNDRLNRLLQGRKFEFEPLLDDSFDTLATHISSMCSQLVSIVPETKRDLLRDIILLLGDQTEDELRVSLRQTDSSSRRSPHQSALLKVLTCLAVGAEKFTSAQPEQRALLLVALVANGDDESLSTISKATADQSESKQAYASTLVADKLSATSADATSRGIPVLFGL